MELMSSSYSMTVNYEGFICYSDGSSPSLPKSFPPSWAPDGEEPPLHFSIGSDVSLITETDMLT